MNAGAPSPSELAELALAVAREAVVLVQGRRAAGVTVASTKSNEADIVTEADHASEALIRDRISTARPTDGFLGEEGADVVSRSGVRWIVDPIDGTVNFLYGIAQYAVSIAAEVDGDVVAGVVINAATGTEYVAHRADAAGPALATRDGAPLAVRGPAPLLLSLIGTGFNYGSRLRELQGVALSRFLPRVRDIRRLGSCALDLCAVAEGSLDGYFEEGVNLWDHAAGGLVAEIAGARVDSLPGVGGGYLLVCAPDHGFDALVAALRETGFSPDSGE